MKKAIRGFVRGLHKNIVWIMLAAFLVTFAGGIIYYATTGVSGWISVIASFQHSLLALIFSPVIKVRDIAEWMEGWKPDEALGIFTIFCIYVVMVLNIIALELIPVIELFITYGVVKSLLKLPGIHGIHHKRILVVGFNDEAKKVLRSEYTDSTVYFWQEKDAELTKEDEEELTENGIRIVKGSFAIFNHAIPGKVNTTEISYFIHKKKITDILIMADNDARSFAYYVALSECDACKKSRVRFNVFSTDAELRRGIELYFNHKVRQDRNALKNGERSAAYRDLRFFNLQMIQAEKLFRDMPVFTKQESNYDVDMLIVGGGALGREIAVAALNQTIYTDSNRIDIEIVDNDIENVRNELARTFNTDYVRWNDEDKTFSIDGDFCDGIFRISLKKFDVHSHEFMEHVKENADRYNYVVVSVREESDNLLCATSFKKYFETNNRVKVAYRLPETPELLEYLVKEGRGCMIGAHEEYVSLDDIIDLEKEKKIRDYHFRTAGVEKGVKLSKKERRALEEVKANSWNCQEMYKRSSNRAMEAHDFNKKVVFFPANNQALLDECESFWKENADGGTDVCYSEALISGRFPLMESWAKAEHRRFCYYYASQGWGNMKGAAKDEANRLHNCLWNWDILVKEQKWSLIYDLLSSPLKPKDHNMKRNKGIK